MQYPSIEKSVEGIFYSLKSINMKEVEFLQFIIENLVKNTEDITIEHSQDELGILLTLTVNKEDMGIIIGKGGNTINSIRSILRLFGMKADKRINLKVLD